MTHRALLLATGLSALTLLAACADPVDPVPSVRPAIHAAVSNSSQGSQKCDAAPAAGMGAYNMIADPSMGDIPMERDAPQGNAGMWTAAYASGCW